VHLLYMDDSGSVSNTSERYLVLAGVAVFERRLFHLITSLDDIVRGFKIGDPHEVELHGSPMYSGTKEPWHSIGRARRESMIQTALTAIIDGRTTLKLFAAVIDKAAASPRDPVEMAFEEVSNRFNLLLQRLNNRNPDDMQKGLIIMDETRHEGALQALARHFRINGARWGHFRNLAEVPLFVDSKASRLIQLADLVAWATWRRYEHQDGRFFDRLISRFDQDGGVIHGLFHYHARGEVCYCPACTSRNLRDAARTIPIFRGGNGD
jgi:hypothetical protein